MGGGFGWEYVEVVFVDEIFVLVFVEFGIVVVDGEIVVFGIFDEDGVGVVFY